MALLGGKGRKGRSSEKEGVPGLEKAEKDRDGSRQSTKGREEAWGGKRESLNERKGQKADEKTAGKFRNCLSAIQGGDKNR